MLTTLALALVLSTPPDAGAPLPGLPVETITLHATTTQLVLTVGTTTLAPLPVTRDAKRGLDLTKLREQLREIVEHLPDQHSLTIVQSPGLTDADLQQIVRVCGEERFPSVAVRRAAPGEVPPDETPPTPTELAVVGELEPAVVQKVLDAHRADVTGCLKGRKAKRIAVKLIVDGKGQVINAAVQQDTGADAELSACVAKAVGRWTFPKPKKGSVVITAPFSAP